MSSPLLEHHSLVHEPSSHLNFDVNDVELALEVTQEGVAFIDELLLVPCHGDMTLDLTITNQVVELQRDMDESKASIMLQNKVLLWLFGGGVNANDEEDYTSMGLAKLFAFIVM